MSGPNRRTFLTTLAAGLTLPAPSAWCAPKPPVGVVRSQLFEELLAEYHTRQKRFSKDMTDLAREVRTLGDEAAARDLESRALPPSENSLQIDDLPDTVLPQISRGLPPAEQNWRMRTRTLETQYALDLVKQGDNARVKGQMSLAWWLVREAAFRDPDQQRARTLLGYVQYNNEWMTPFRLQMLKTGKVWDPQFGWISSEDLPKYQQGMRKFKGRWMAADREASLRTRMEDAWVAESEHFQIQSNYSLERAVQISVDLERFHNFFVRTFASVFMTPRQMQMLFEGTAPGSATTRPRHAVRYYRTRQEFVAALVATQPDVAMSNGMYVPGGASKGSRTNSRGINMSYFFHTNDLDQVAETMFHETTHQILSESSIPTIGSDHWTDGDFWLVEGLACYMESFKPAQRGGTVGDPDHTRIAWARKYRLEEGFHIPIETLCAMTQRDFQCLNLTGQDRIKRLQRYYALSAGVAHFFLHAQEGAYRDALITYLAQIYSADLRVRKNARNLAELTGVSFAELDRQYLQHLEHLEANSRQRIQRVPAEAN